MCTIMPVHAQRSKGTSDEQCNLPGDHCACVCMPPHCIWLSGRSSADDRMLPACCRCRSDVMLDAVSQRGAGRGMP